MSTASAGSRLATLLAPVVGHNGLDLEDVAVTLAGKNGRRSQVRVLVDKDGGISLDDVALISRAISDALDSTAEADAILGGAAYVLEVSSPGVDRPLVESRHWRRAVGRLVRVPLVAGGDVTGRLIAAEADGVRLLISAGRSETERSFAFAELGAGRVQVEFNRAPSADDTDPTDPTDPDAARAPAPAVRAADDDVLGEESG
jgi:ribosome maturation factor RimP